MKRYHILGITLIAGFMLGCAVPAHAINHAYRAQLERSGCNEMNAGQGCDIHKNREENQRYMAPRHRDFTNDADVVIGTNINEAADYLLSKGWKPNNGDWHKGNRLLRLVVDNGRVVNAQVM